MSYTAKKWLARAILIALFVGLVYILGAAFDDSENWATAVLTGLAVTALLEFYRDVLKPDQPVAPATGFEDAAEGPTIGTSKWQYYVPATEETIRAALLSTHDENFGEIDLRHLDHSLRAIRSKDGWKMKRIFLASGRMDISIKKAAATATPPIRRTFWNAVRGKLDGESFSNLEAEAALIAFLQRGPSGPALTWQQATRD